MCLTREYIMRDLKTVSILILLMSLVSIVFSGCGSGIVYENEATATAQAERAVVQATAMARRLQETVQTLNEQAAATAVAKKVLFDKAATWPVVHSDAFEANEVDWFEGSDDDPQFALINWEIAGGKYTWRADAYDGFVWWVVPEVERVDDFYYSLTAQQLEGPETGEYGLVFRQNDNGSYYVFGISEVGQFSVFLFDGQHWVTLKDWSESAAINSDAPNILSVIAQNTSYYLFINGELVGEIDDVRLAGGQVGLMISLSEEGDEATWEFDNFELRAP
jgi:hypothetical protein